MSQNGFPSGDFFRVMAQLQDLRDALPATNSNPANSNPANSNPAAMGSSSAPDADLFPTTSEPSRWQLRDALEDAIRRGYSLSRDVSEVQKLAHALSETFPCRNFEKCVIRALEKKVDLGRYDDVVTKLVCRGLENMRAEFHSLKAREEKREIKREKLMAKVYELDDEEKVLESDMAEILGTIGVAKMAFGKNKGWDAEETARQLGDDDEVLEDNGNE